MSPIVLSVRGPLLWSSMPTRNKKQHTGSLVGSAVIKTIKLGDRLERDVGLQNPQAKTQT